jgi:glycosyltransferase involved in cell wall biosynthesis
VAFDCRTGPREVITRGESGLLVSEGDVPGLAKGIRRLIEDPDLRGRIGANARLAAARYSSEAVSRYWQDFLDELTSSPPGDRRGAMPRPRIRRPKRRPDPSR